MNYKKFKEKDLLSKIKKFVWNFELKSKFKPIRDIDSFLTSKFGGRKYIHEFKFKGNFLDKELKSYIEIEVYFDTLIPFYIVRIPNKSFGCANIEYGLLRALESAVVGDVKYLRLKEKYRSEK